MLSVTFLNPLMSVIIQSDTFLKCYAGRHYANFGIFKCDSGCGIF
jgi:hypothetical protein